MIQIVQTSFQTVLHPCLHKGTALIDQIRSLGKHLTRNALHILFCSTTKSSVADKTDIKPSYWCVLCRENGALEIYSVPDFKLVFCVRNFAVAPKVLVDSGATG